jgi:ribonuclease HI
LNSFYKNKILLFTDGSVDVQTNTGYGACLVITDSGISHEVLKKQVKVKRFEETSSTKLELQTLLWALHDMPASQKKVIIFTDSQNIPGLLRRRERLENKDYFSGNNRRIKHYELYQEFFRIMDSLDCEFVKVRGHQPTKDKDEIHRLFTLVDRASRRALRKDKSHLKYPAK